MEPKLTGYPSIDKPWLKYYSEEAINAPLPECTIYEYLYERNKDYGKEVAIEYFGKKTTYGGLFKEVDRCKAALIDLGVKKGDIITIQSLTMPQIVLLFYAVSRIGAIAHFIYATADEEEVKNTLISTRSEYYFVIDAIYEKFSAKAFDETNIRKVILMSVADEADALTKFVINSKQAFGKKRVEHGKNVILWKEFFEVATEKDVLEDVVEKNLPVVMVGTGGTTGISKSVVLTNKNFNTVSEQYVNAGMGYIRQATSLDTLPPFIAFGLTIGLHVPLCNGVKTILLLDCSPDKAGEYFAKYKPNYCVNGPVQVQKVIENKKCKKMKFDFLVQYAVGGTALLVYQEQEINKFFEEHSSSIKITKGYGMTEVTATISAEVPGEFREGSVGIPLPFTNIKIIDVDTMNELHCGEQGEICVLSPCNMVGYYDNAEATSGVKIRHDDGNEWIHTGDIGYVDEDGFLFIVDRIKRIILCIEGEICHKVFPKPLEEQLETLPEVEAVTVVGRPKEITGTDNDLIAFVVKSEEVTKEACVESVRSFTEENFASYERPAEVRVIEKFPRTLIGKVDYRALEKEAAEVK